MKEALIIIFTVGFLIWFYGLITPEVINTQQIPIDYCASLGYAGYEGWGNFGDRCFKYVDGFKEYTNKLPENKEMKRLLEMNE